jgi:hypothetical protein
MIPTCIGVTLRSNADGSKDEDCAGGDANKNGVMMLEDSF